MVVDDRSPLAFNPTLTLLSLSLMGAGSLLRVRMYLAVGFAGVVVNVGSITVKTLAAADRTLRMSAIGAIVLALGVLLIAGTIFVKTHRAAVDETVGRWRRRLGEWE